MIGPGGVVLVEPHELENAPQVERDLYEAGRAYGRYEADNAICWMTACTQCARHLDEHAEGFFQGERTGIAQAIHTVAEGRSSDPATQVVLDVVQAKLHRLAAGYDGMPPLDHKTAEDRIRAYREALTRAGFIKDEPVVAVAGERASYPADAYEAACAASREHKARADAAEAELAELRAVFELQWTRMDEATKWWRAEDPGARALIMPDLGDLLRWLMDQAGNVRAEPGHPSDSVVQVTPDPAMDQIIQAP